MAQNDQHTLMHSSNIMDNRQLFKVLQHVLNELVA